MKNFYIQTIVLLFVVLAGFTSKSNAQFASSNEVYCYQYVKTVEDGVTSYNPNYVKKTKGPEYSGQDEELYFVIFQGNRMAFRKVEDVAKYRSKVLTEPDYFSFNGIKGHMDFDINRNQIDYRYNPAASTSSKYTYREYQFREGKIWSPAENCFVNGTHWNYICFSFSLDKSEMIIWFPENDKGRRYHYKRIDINSIKPNLDFLD